MQMYGRRWNKKVHDRERILCTSIFTFGTLPYVIVRFSFIQSSWLYARLPFSLSMHAFEGYVWSVLLFDKYWILRNFFSYFVFSNSLLHGLWLDGGFMSPHSAKMSM